MADDQPVRLYCFPNSPEGVCVFDDWAERTGAGVRPVPVALPGAGERRREPRATTARALLADVMPQLTGPRPAGPDGPGPYLLYGHALGAMAALAAARTLHESSLPGPALLVVGAWPPSHPPLGPADPGRATDDELLRILSGNGAIPAGSDEAVWLRAMLPALRADLELAQDLYALAERPLPGGPLTTPVLVLDPPHGPPSRPPAADSWRRWTSGPVFTRTVHGPGYFRRGTVRLPRTLGRLCRTAARLTHTPQPVA